MPRYSNNFLSNVFIEVQFDDVSLTALETYKTAIVGTFDIVKQASGFESSINLDGSDGTFKSSKKELTIWNFNSTTFPDKSLTLSQKSIVLSYASCSYVVSGTP